MKHHTITIAKPIDPKLLHMGIEFDNDPMIVVDLSGIFAQGGVFTPLRATDRFEAVKVSPDGDALFWQTGPGEDDVVDLCADALWLLAHPEDRAAAVAEAYGGVVSIASSPSEADTSIVWRTKDLEARVAGLEQTARSTTQALEEIRDKLGLAETRGAPKR